MKKLIVIAVFALVVAAIVQWVIAFVQEAEFNDKVHQLALKVTDTNHDEIRRGVIEEAQKINATVRAEDVQIGYAPTKDLSYPQSVVGKLATFDNYRATITAVYRQPFLFVIPRAHRVETSALIQSAAKARVPRELPEP